MHAIARFEFDSRRCFLGAYWERNVEKYYTGNDYVEVGEPQLERCERVDLWVCLVPMLTLHVVIAWGVRPLTVEEIATDNLEASAEW